MTQEEKSLLTQFIGKHNLADFIYTEMLKDHHDKQAFNRPSEHLTDMQESAILLAEQIEEEIEEKL